MITITRHMDQPTLERQFNRGFHGGRIHTVEAIARAYYAAVEKQQSQEQKQKQAPFSNQQR